jgi:ferritin-like protein
MADLHESPEDLSDACRDLHRAINSLREELEAVDWYQQRVEACHDAELRSVLEHNRDEEIEHACMAIEWLRRNVPAWDENLRKYLFRSGPIVGSEHVEPTSDGDLGLGLGLGKLQGAGS